MCVEIAGLRSSYRTLLDVGRARAERGITAPAAQLGPELQDAAGRGGGSRARAAGGVSY